VRSAHSGPSFAPRDTLHACERWWPCLPRGLAARVEEYDSPWPCVVSLPPGSSQPSPLLSDVERVRRSTIPPRFSTRPAERAHLGPATLRPAVKRTVASTISDATDLLRRASRLRAWHFPRLLASAKETNTEALAGSSLPLHSDRRRSGGKWRDPPGGRLDTAWASSSLHSMTRDQVWGKGRCLKSPMYAFASAGNSRIVS